MSETPLIHGAADGAYQEGREDHGHIKSFVRRAGRMSDAQQRYLDEMMPKIGLPYQALAIDLPAVYGRNAPKILEIGCGMGETTAKIAEAHPENDYFGLEVHIPGIGALCKLIAEKQLSNLRIGNHDAVEVVRGQSIRIEHDDIVKNKVRIEAFPSGLNFANTNLLSDCPRCGSLDFRT